MKKTLLILTLLTLFCIPIYTQTHANNSVSAAAAQSEAIPKRSVFRPTKEQIKQAQEKLSASGVYSGPSDGRYNDDFRAALKTFQESSQLEVTGKLDEATVLKLGIELTDRQKGIDTDDSKPKRSVFRPSRDQIESAQRILKESGGYSGAETGRYNKEFRTAIREYQSENGLKRKGSLNRATLEKMGIELTEAQAAIPVNPSDLASADDGEPKKRGPVFRATKDQITEVQKMLRGAGLYNGEETGKFNDEFRTAIKQWQEANSVRVTGTLNKLTLEAMRIELTDRQKEM